VLPSPPSSCLGRPTLRIADFRIDKLAQHLSAPLERPPHPRPSSANNPPRRQQGSRRDGGQRALLTRRDTVLQPSLHPNLPKSAVPYVGQSSRIRPLWSHQPTERYTVRRRTFWVESRRTPGVGRRDRSFAASRPRTVNRRAPSRAKPRNSNRRRSRQRIASCSLAARQRVCTETNYSDFAAKKPRLDSPEQPMSETRIDRAE
jgi:hypothetical protein